MQWSTNYAAGGTCIVGCTGLPGLGPNYLTVPRDLKFDPSGNLYVTDQGNNRVQKFMIQPSTTNCTFSK
jgi:DNA-binding beta-propeller fold protein YncE